MLSSRKSRMMLTAVSSDEFSQSLKDSINFDALQLSDSMKKVSSDTDDLANEYYKLAAQVDDLEQYTHRTNIRVYRIPETIEGPEDRDSLITDFLSKELGFNLQPSKISCSHRIGKKAGNKPWPIIVCPTRHNTKVIILKNIRQLKINKMPFNIQEDLTLPRRDHQIP